MFTTGTYGCAAGPGFAFLKLQNFFVVLHKELAYHISTMQRQTPIFQQEVRDGPGNDEQ